MNEIPNDKYPSLLRLNLSYAPKVHGGHDIYSFFVCKLAGRVGKSPLGCLEVKKYSVSQSAVAFCEGLNKLM